MMDGTIGLFVYSARLPEAYNLLMKHAAECRMNGFYQDAVRACMKVIEAFPSYEIAYRDLANVYGLLGQHDKEVETLSSVLAFNPNYSDAIYNLSLVYRDLGHLEAAHTHVIRFLELAPSDADGYFLAASILDRMGEHAKEIELYHRGLERAPENSTSWTNLGIAAAQIGDFTSSISALRKASTLDPNSARIMWELARVLEKAGIWAEAAQAYLAIQRRAGESVDLGFSIGYAYHRAHQNRDAVQALTRVIELDPNRVDALVLLAVASVNCGDKSGAQRYYLRAARIAPAEADKIAHLLL